MKNLMTILSADKMLRLDYTREEWIAIAKMLFILLIAILAAVIE